MEKACAIAYCGWRGGYGVETVGQAEEFFYRVCRMCDYGPVDGISSKDFTNWFDETPREDMRRELLAEVEFNLGRMADPTLEVACP